VDLESAVGSKMMILAAKSHQKKLATATVKGADLMMIKVVIARITIW
jgi:hypothetical protein